MPDDPTIAWYTTLNRGMRAVNRVIGHRGIGYVLLLTVMVTFGGAAGMAQFESPTALGQADAPAEATIGGATSDDRSPVTASELGALRREIAALRADMAALTDRLDPTCGRADRPGGVPASATVDARQPTGPCRKPAYGG